jgi:DNA-binding LacI/PurR family transcriptional regulator
MSNVSDASGSLINASPRVRALNRLRQWLDDGTLQPGDVIPPERELSRRLGISLATLHRATKALEVEGRLRALGGKTRIVAERVEGQAKLLRNTIAVLAPSRKPLPEHRATGWSDYLSIGAFDAIETAGFHALAFHAERRSDEELDDLITAKPLGAVLPEVADRKKLPVWIVDKLLAAGIHVTVFGDPPEAKAYDRIVSDHAAGAEAITAWMIAQGRKRILQVLPALDEYWVDMRREGYERAMRQAGLEPLPQARFVRMTPTDAGFPDGTRDLFEAFTAYDSGCLLPILKSDPSVDAMLLPSDGSVWTAAAACRRLGREPNRDILLAGYDNYWSDSWERQFESAGPVVTVDRNNPTLGQEMVRLLLDRIEGKLPKQPVCRRVQPQLVEVDRSR